MVSSGRAGLAPAAAAKSCSCSFILLAKVTWLKEKPNACPSGSEKEGEAHSELQNANRDAILPCHPALRAVQSAHGATRRPQLLTLPGTGGLGSPGGFGEPGHPAHSPSSLLKFLNGVTEQSPFRKTGDILERGGIFQSSFPAVLWRCKARIDGKASSFI